MTISYMLQKPDFSEETIHWNQGYTFVAGVDEVGRGAFAGPIVASAVILPPTFVCPDINDSKLLTPTKRQEFARIIQQEALYFSIAEIGLDIINKEGIGKANQDALSRAVTKILRDKDIKDKQKDSPNISNCFVLVDGFPIYSLPSTSQKALIKGDRKSISIAAASIIAKVYRDKLMENLADNYPMFGFSQNKGYGTLAHRNAIKEYGLCDLHRTSFNLNPYLNS